MDDGVELKQLTVGVDSVGLGVGAGPLANAIVLMAISAASVVIVLIILLFVSGCLVVIAGKPLWQSKRKLLWGLGGYFSLLLRELQGEVLETS